MTLSHLAARNLPALTNTYGIVLLIFGYISQLNCLKKYVNRTKISLCVEWVGDMLTLRPLDTKLITLGFYRAKPL